jgi:fatty-acyl-CoA synthase
VVDGDGRAVGPNQVGELLIAGPHLCKGYWKDEKMFREALRDGFFATGDLVRVDPEGFFYVVGRLKDMYISGGENVYPGEVEKQIVAHPEITHAVVVPVPDEKWTEVGFAFFLGQRDFTLNKIRTWLDPRLARYKHPHYIRRLAALPLLANGKIDRRALKDEALRFSGKGT